MQSSVSKSNVIYSFYKAWLINNLHFSKKHLSLRQIFSGIDGQAFFESLFSYLEVKTTKD